MSIKQDSLKIKGQDRQDVDTNQYSGKNEIFLILLVSLIAFISFGLGRLSTIDSTPKNPIHIEDSVQYQGATSNGALQNTLKTTSKGEIGGFLVASKSGSKYHFPWCSGAGRIKEENKIWFNTVGDARAAGYTPAANCKGLE